MILWCATATSPVCLVICYEWCYCTISQMVIMASRCVNSHFSFNPFMRYLCVVDCLWSGRVSDDVPFFTLVPLLLSDTRLFDNWVYRHSQPFSLSPSVSYLPWLNTMNSPLAQLFFEYGTQNLVSHFDLFLDWSFRGWNTSNRWW